MNVKYSNMALIGFIFIIAIAILVSGFGSSDLDQICSDNGDMLIRYAGSWVCSTDYYFEEDLRFPTSLIQTRGVSNLPEFKELRDGLYGLAFDDSTLEQAYVSFQLPHGREDSSDLELHFHWTQDHNDSGSVVWCVDLECANLNTVFGSLVSECVVSNGTIEFNHTLSSEMVFTNSLNYSSMCLSRIYRNASGTSDNFTGDAFLLEFDIHYKNINLGKVH